MGEMALPLAIYAGGTVAKAFAGSGTQKTETQYHSEPFTYTLPSGAKITLYHNTPTGTETSTDRSFGSTLLDAAGSGAQAYGVGSMMKGAGAAVAEPAGNLVMADANAAQSYTDYSLDKVLGDAQFPDYVKDWYKNKG